jgi:uncharacterized DUF497 family protein
MLISEFEWDDENAWHVARHGLDSARLNGMLCSRITVVRNKRRLSGLYKLIGTETGGQVVTVVVARTSVRGRWRPVTGWRSTDAEKAIHGR